MQCQALFYACLFLATADTQILTAEFGTHDVAQEIPKSENGVETKYNNAFPWHVGVYRNNGTGYYDQICAGTLISPDIVISAAHCFDEVNNPNDFVIAAGKYHRQYYWPEPNAQKSSVKGIEKAKEYVGLGGNYGADIALVRLETPFDITERVKPVCIDWGNVHGSEQLAVGRIGKVMGWGVTEASESGNDLREINLPFVPYDECSAAVPEDFHGFVSATDKFCAGYLNGSSVCNGDSGGGLCFKCGDFWYLRGVVSAIPSAARGDPDLRCNHNQYTAFTNVGNFLEWIRAAYDRAGPNGCVVPKPRTGGNFEVSCQGECSVEPGSTVPMNSILIHRCLTDYVLRGNVASLCTPNGWNSLPACIKTCEPLVSKIESIVCKYEGQIVPCDSRMEPGTKASLTCPTFYKISDTHDSKYEEMTCLEKGEWNRPPLRCIPVCGRAPNSESRFSYGDTGNSILYTSLPWEVVVIQIKSGTSREFSGLSGTLIKPNLVILAVDNSGNRQGPDVKDLVVVAGRYFDFNTTAKSFKQHSLVESINFLEVNNSAGLPGLTLLRLARPFNMTTWLRPVCMDWDNRFLTRQLRERNNGKISTNFLNIEGSVRRRTEVEVAYIPREDCLSMIEEKDKSYVLNGSFCGDHVTDTKLSRTCDHPYIGAGLSFKSDGVWYLRGVLSRCVKRRDSPTRISDFVHFYILFKGVGHYLESIRDAYDAS